MELKPLVLVLLLLDTTQLPTHRTYESEGTHHGK